MTGLTSRLSKLVLVFPAVAVGLLGSCNFDSAFERYCANNPRCADAAAGPEAGPEVAPDLGPDLRPDVGPDLGPDLEPDLGPDLLPHMDRDGGPPGTPSFLPLPSSCTSDADCGSRELCHPVGKVCMIACRSQNECPKWLDTCGDLPVPGGGRTPRMVCMCSGNTSCAERVGSAYLCSPIDNVCELACGPAVDCGNLFRPQRSCNADLVCVPPCSSNAACSSPAQPRCDSAKGCVGCVDDSDCAGRGDNLSRCSSSGSCVAPTSSP